MSLDKVSPNHNGRNCPPAKEEEEGWRKEEDRELSEVAVVRGTVGNVPTVEGEGEEWAEWMGREGKFWTEADAMPESHAGSTAEEVEEEEEEGEKGREMASQTKSTAPLSASACVHMCVCVCVCVCVSVCVHAHVYVVL